MNNHNKLEIKKINNFLYTMDYPYDYGLDEIIETGTHNIKELALFVQKRFNLKIRPKFESSGFACTTFNFNNEKNDHLLARNFDYKNGPCLLLKTNPKHGYKSIGIACMNCMLYGFHHFNKEGVSNKRLFLAPYACMDGINEKGLAIAVLQVKTKSTKQQGEHAVTTTVAIRAILDKCATVDEAIEFFKTHPMNDLLGRNYHYQIADASGKTAIVEFVNNILHVHNSNKYMHLENFFITEGGDNRKGVGFTRRKWLDAMYEETKGQMSEQQAMDMLKKVKLHYRSKRGYIVQTLWSEIFNCNTKQMQLCTGSDFTKTYTFDV